jgi:hypothetical protein
MNVKTFLNIDHHSRFLLNVYSKSLQATRCALLLLWVTIVLNHRIATIQQ